MRALLVSIRYVLTNALMTMFIAALAFGHWSIWAVVVLSVVTGVAIDEVLGDDSERIDGRGQLLFDANLYATLPLLVIMSCMMFRLITANSTTDVAAHSGAVALIGPVVGAGYFYALAGVTVGHELTHRVSNPIALIWARVLFAFTVNPTFETYHVHGHHRNVCTYRDPATARRGEYVLAFVARTLIYQSLEGWRLETERLRRNGLPFWSLHNRVLAGAFCTMAILSIATLIAGARGGIAFLVAAFFGRILHEMINYVQHYGIVRAEGTPIEVRHAWDSCHLLSNALFYNLPRHADHHRSATKPFWALEAPADSPKLPHGYQTMAMIALMAPLWHRRIDPLLVDWDRRLASDIERALVQDRGWSIDVPRPHQATGLIAVDRAAESASYRTSGGEGSLP